MALSDNSTPIQKHLDIKEIKNDVIILKSKELRAVLMANSLNFSLKSAEEQDAIVYRYQEFLNSLDFSIQILTSSRQFDITEYIESLEKRQARQENDLLKIQTAEYIDFIKSLSEIANIMASSFYLVVPYTPNVFKKGGFLSGLFGKKKKSEAENQHFQTLKNSLWQRVEFVATGLSSMGIRTAPLKTDELIELFYKLYNPGAKEEPELPRNKKLKLE